MKAFPELLRAGGYYTTNNGKTDYQFGDPFTVWDANAPDADWRGRAEGQPFFAMFNILLTHESYIWPTDRKTDNPLLAAVTQRNRNDLANKVRVTDPADVIVPPYLPDTPTVREDIATHYDNIAFAERQVADILARLEEDGLLGETIIIVTSDHGDGFPRMKRTVYDSGIKVPMMIRYPDGAMAGTSDDRLVSFVDLAPTILAMADLATPEFVQGGNFTTGQARDFIFAAADRHDAAPGRTKAVRDARFKYIRNYNPELAVLRPLAFRDALPTMQEIWRLARAGELTDDQRRLVESPRGAEELYDLLADPDEVRNLAGNPAYADTKQRLSAALDQWIERTGDLSAMPEPEMIAAMWPGMVQPVTAAPEFSSNDGRVSISSATLGAGIAFSLDGSDPAAGQIYTGPVSVAAGQVLKAKAVRYGYAASEERAFTSQ